MIETGIKNKKSLTVTKELTAKAVGSGSLEVFSTPSLLALMELTAAESVKDKLEQGQSTVGTSAALKHIAATPIGMKVTCESELCEIDRRRLVFDIKAYDEKELVAECRHERFIVNDEKFMSKANSKKED